MTTSTSSLSSITAPVMLSSAVTLHTSSGTLAETASEPDTQMMALQQMFTLLTSDEMVIAESERTREAAQRAFDKLYQDFLRVTEANDTLRTQAIQLKGQLSQLKCVHEAEPNALNEQLRLAQQLVLATQQDKDAAVRRCQEDVAAVTLRQLETVQATQDAALTQMETLESSHRAQGEALTNSHRAQRETLENSHRSAIATLNQSHQRAISDLQNQLTQKRGDTQAAALRIAHKEQEVQRLKMEVQNLTASLSQTQSQMKSLLHEATVLEAAHKAGL